MKRREEKTRKARAGTHAPSRRKSEGLISACAALSLLRSTPLPPPFSEGKSPLSYQPPPPPPLPLHRYQPLSRVPSVPLRPPLFYSSFFPSSPAIPSAPHCLMHPSGSRFPFSSPDFPSLSLRRAEYPASRDFPRQTRLSVSAFMPSFSLVGQFHPLPIRAAHCSRVSRIAEVKPSDDFLAGTWFRALLFSSLSPFLSVSLSLSPPRFYLLSSQELLLPMTGRGHTRSVDRDGTSEGETDFRDDRCHCQ